MLGLYINSFRLGRIWTALLQSDMISILRIYVQDLQQCWKSKWKRPPGRCLADVERQYDICVPTTCWVSNSFVPKAGNLGGPLNTLFTEKGTAIWGGRRRLVGCDRKHTWTRAKLYKILNFLTISSHLSPWHGEHVENFSWLQHLPLEKTLWCTLYNNHYKAMKHHTIPYTYHCRILDCREFTKLVL